MLIDVASAPRLKVALPAPSEQTLRAVNRAQILSFDRRYVWRPYTSSEDHERGDDLVVVGAEGAHLLDADGRRFLDATSSWWTCNLGYGHPRLVAALERQARSLAHVAMAGATHRPAAELAERLVAAAPKGDRRLSRVFYSDDGSTSVEAALKIAFQYWAQNGRPERTRFLALPGAYHGDTLGAMSVGALEEVGRVFRPLLIGLNDAPQPHTAGEWERAIDALVATLEAEGDRIAGVVVEPLVQGAAGMQIYAPALLARLREACDRADTFLIADEVFTGLGRTGTLWACEQAGVVPDLLCAAKGLGGGLLPFAATLATERIFEGFRGDMSRALLHGHTFCGNPLGAAVALEVLQVMSDERVLENLAPKAAAIARRFEQLAVLNGASRPRALGMIGAIDLGGGGYLGRTGWRVHEAAKRRGVLLRPLGDTVYVVPPLTIGEDDLAWLLDAVEASVREVMT